MDVDGFSEVRNPKSDHEKTDFISSIEGLEQYEVLLPEEWGT